VSHFELKLEQKLLAMPDEDSDEFNPDSSSNGNSPRRKPAESRRTASKLSHGNLKPREDIYIVNYRKQRRLFKHLLAQKAEMRREQITYILNTLRILTVFLQVVSLIGYRGKQKPKFDSFVLTIEKRLKMTNFLLIQRMGDEERLHRVAKEAIDMHELSLKMAKNRAHAAKTRDSHQVEELLH
jgi:hypothetical protein